MSGGPSPVGRHSSPSSFIATVPAVKRNTAEMTMDRVTSFLVIRNSKRVTPPSGAVWVRREMDPRTYSHFTGFLVPVNPLLFSEQLVLKYY